MAKMVYVDPKLIAGENLRYAVFVKELDERWVLQSAAPETRNVDEYENVTEEQVLQMFPELGELFELELDKNVTFMKTKSGRWVDFV